MFYKHVTIEFIERELIQAPEYIEQKYYIDVRLDSHMYSKIFKENKEIINIFIKNGMNEIYQSQLDGAIIESYIFKECIDFL